MKRFVLAAAVALLAMTAAASAQQKYTFALVPKNMNNPFFDQARDGCKKAEAESNGAFECMYIGPGEHGGGDEQVTIVQDLVAKKVDGIAVSPSNAAAMAVALCRRRRKPASRCSPGTPTFCRRTRICALPISARTTTRSARTSPSSSRPSSRMAARSASSRVARRRPTTMNACRAFATRWPARPRRLRPATASPARMAGPRSTAARSTPMTISRARCSSSKTSWPRIPTSTPSSRPAASRNSFRTPTARRSRPYKDKIASKALVLVVADTLPVQIDQMKEGLSLGQVGQRPFEMGYKTMNALRDMKDGKAAPADPTYTGLDVCTPETADTCIAK